MTGTLLYPPDQTNYLLVPAPAILFLPLSFLLLRNILIKLGATPEHQSSDAKPWQAVIMHSPYNNSTSWETKQCMK